MELTSRVLAEVEPGDMSPGVPGPFTPVTDGSWELVPVHLSHSSVKELAAAASTSHQDAAGLKGATLRAPIASLPQNSRSASTEIIPDVQSEICEGV